MEITCYRDNEINRDARHLPAITYNLAVTLLARCSTGNLFVPIRSMQYMGIVDHEEFVFIDAERKCWIDVAWRNFQSRTRNALDEPVAYDAVYYRHDMIQVMPRLQSEFSRALQILATKGRLDGSAKVLKFPAARV